MLVHIQYSTCLKDIVTDEVSHCEMSWLPRRHLSCCIVGKQEQRCISDGSLLSLFKSPLFHWCGNISLEISDSCVEKKKKNTKLNCLSFALVCKEKNNGLPPVFSLILSPLPVVHPTVVSQLTDGCSVKMIIPLCRPWGV